MVHNPVLFKEKKCETYRIDSSANCNQMLFRLFKTLFQKSAAEASFAIGNKAVVLKTCNNLDTEQLSVFSVKIRLKDRVVRCKFFAVPGDSPAVLGIPDMEWLGLLMFMCNVMEGQQDGRKFDS